jgi:hypothetical protein
LPILLLIPSLISIVLYYKNSSLNIMDYSQTQIPAINCASFCLFYYLPNHFYCLLKKPMEIIFIIKMSFNSLFTIWLLYKKCPIDGCAKKIMFLNSI